MAEPVGLGILGVGRWATAHAEASSRTGAVRFVNCLSRTEERREAFRHQHGIARSSGTLVELLGDPAVEAVVISTPNDIHVLQALACLAAGKPALVDKPVAVDMGEGLELLRAVDRSPVPLGVAHHARRLAGVRAAREWIVGGHAGVVRAAHADFSNNRSAHLRPDAWHRFARGSEGGVLIQVGIHQIDNMLYLLGPVTAVNARFTHQTIEMPDLAVVTMQHAGGAVSVVTSSWTTPSHFGFEVLATGGNLTYSLDHGSWTRPDVDEHGTLTVDPPWKPQAAADDPLRIQLEELASAARGTGSMQVDVLAGLRAAAVVGASVRSAAAEGAPVLIEDVIRESGGTDEEIRRLLTEGKRP